MAEGRTSRRGGGVNKKELLVMIMDEIDTKLAAKNDSLEELKSIRKTHLSLQ